VNIKVEKSKILNDSCKFFFLFNGIVTLLWIIEIVVVFIFNNKSYTCTTSLALIDALFLAYLLSSLMINAYHLWKKEIPSFKEVSIIGLLTIVTSLGWYLTSMYVFSLDSCSYSFITQDQFINIFARKF
jgi:hypothetical protein